MNIRLSASQHNQISPEHSILKQCTATEADDAGALECLGWQQGIGVNGLGVLPRTSSLCSADTDANADT